MAIRGGNTMSKTNGAAEVAESGWTFRRHGQVLMT